MLRIWAGGWWTEARCGEVFGGDDPGALDGNVGISDLKLALHTTIEQRQWAKAAQHHLGGGLERGLSRCGLFLGGLVAFRTSIARPTCDPAVPSAAWRFRKEQA